MATEDVATWFEREPDLVWRDMWSGGNADRHRITLAYHAGWPTFAHELAHAVEHATGVWRRRREAGMRRVFHNKEFERLAARILRTIRRRGYDRGALSERKAWNENVRRDKAAEVPEEDPRIGQREAQIVRLEARIRQRESQI